MKNQTKKAPKKAKKMGMFAALIAGMENPDLKFQATADGKFIVKN